MPRLMLLLLLASIAAAVDPLTALVDAPVVDEVRLAEADPGHRFVELPAGCSRIATHAGIACRVLPN